MDDFEAPTLPDRIGRLGRYTLLADLAEGGMAKVYLARRDGAAHPCVLKQLHVELEHHPTAAKRFQREAHIVAHMAHPSIAKILGAGLEAGKFCIAMEYVAGQTLEAVLERSAEAGSRVPPPIAVAIALRVLDALSYAHNLSDAEGRPLRLVHRDLSPGNIMLGYDGQVKIIDFGVAQGKIDNFKTAPGMMVGTLRYMSPEQAATSEVDHRSDLYTVGAVLYEMLTGQPVVPRGRPVEVLEAILERVPRPLRSLLPEAPEALDDVVSRALSKQSASRWPDAASFRDALRDSAASLGRANRTHVGLLISQLFPEEELAAQRWQDLASLPSPFGAHDTEDWGSSMTTTGHHSSPETRPAVLPPLRSASLGRPPFGSETDGAMDVLTTLETPSIRAGHRLPDPEAFGLAPDEVFVDTDPTRAGSRDQLPLVRPLAFIDDDSVFEPPEPGASTTASLPAPLEERVTRLEKRIFQLELSLMVLGIVALTIALAALWTRG